MPARLRKLKITAVALVDRGANQLADVLLYKRAEPLAKMDMHGVPLTTQQVLDHHEQCEAWRELRYAFSDSIDSITDYATPEEQGALLLTAVEEFAANAREILATLDMPEALMKRALTEVNGAVDVVKAGRVIAGQRLQRLKQAVMALQAIIMEAEPGEAEKGKQTMAEKRDEMADITKRAETAEAQMVALQGQVTTLEKRQAELLAEVETLQPVDIWKGLAPEMRVRIEKMEQENEGNKLQIRKRDCISTVQKYSLLPMNPDDHWEVIDKINGLPDDVRKKIYSLFDSHQELARTSAVFKRQGVPSGGAAEEDTATGEVQRLAKAYQVTHAELSEGDAISAVFREHPDLYARYRQETATRV
jgi:hypothetical protein